MGETLSQKIEGFRERQKEIMVLDAQVGEKRRELQAEFEQKDAELQKELREKLKSYKDDMRAAFGIADGDNANVLDFMAAIEKVRDL